MLEKFNIFILNKNENESLLNKIKLIFYSFVFSFFLTLFSILLAILPADYFITKCLHYESVKSLIHLSSVKIHILPFYLPLIIGPFFEEVLFRLILKINRLNFAVFILIFTYKVTGGKIIDFSFFQFYKELIFGLIMGCLAYYKFNYCIVTLFKKYFKTITIISIISFGLMHIGNLSIIHYQLLPLYPIFVLPQIIMGYFITNIRLKYGFFWGVLFHSLINLTPVLLSLTAK